MHTLDYWWEKMKSLDKDVRVLIEGQIDNFFEDPEEWEASIRRFLTEQGIESSLETVLALAIGLTLGQACHEIKVKFDRSWTEEEARAISNTLKRRSFELRHLFLSTRIQGRTNEQI